MNSSHSILIQERIEQTLRPGWAHYMYLLVLALGVYGHTLTFGLIYDDILLTREAGLGWLSQPWLCEQYYRPLQVLLFHPSIVTSYPPILHLQNILVGTLVVYLFGCLLMRLGFSFWQRLAIESIGIALPTSMMLFAWVSQRTEWLTDVLSLSLILLTFSRTLSLRAYACVFVLLMSVSLMTKETAVSIALTIPAFVLLVHRRRGSSVVLVLAGVAVLAGWYALRSHILSIQSGYMTNPSRLVRVVIVGMAESTLFSNIQVCYTYNPLFLALNVGFMALGIAGVLWMFRHARTTATGLTVLFFGMSLGTSPLPQPRNLVVPGLVAVTFAVYGLWQICKSGWNWRVKLIVYAVSLANIVALFNITIFHTYPLQDWIQPVNDIVAESRGNAKPRGNMNEIDVNNRFFRNLRQ
jgi:hypothetical protein